MVTIKICLLLPFVLLASGAFTGFVIKPQLDGRIIGGFQIDISQMPWQASIQLKGKHLCGASIISEKWLLTAAHCTGFVPNVESILVRIGSSSCGSGGVLYKVKRIVDHKESGENMDYDYSLLELEESVEFNKKAKPIALPNSEEIVSDNTTCLVTGWGTTHPTDPSQRPDLLRGVEVPIVNQEKCDKIYMNITRITDRMICAGFKKGGKDSCHGDSGGPLVTFDDTNEKAVLIGVVSWGSGCAKPGFPGVYARVQAVRDWIFDYTGI